MRRLADDPRFVRAALAALILASVALAWSNRFVLDDAFISFRYAGHLAEGHGLVWNPGERVEGYTNFLWVLLLAGAMRLGMDPVVFSQAAGMAAFTGTLLVTAALGTTVLRSTAAAVLSVLLLGTSYTFSCFATSGLETQLHALLLTACAGVLARGLVAAEWTAARSVALSLLGALALLTRLDSAVVVGPVLAIACVRILRRGAGVRERLVALAGLAAPASLIVGAWLAWKLSYYGEVVPNSAYVKLGFGAHHGWPYVGRFLRSYWLWPFILGALAVGWRRRSEPRSGPILLLGGLVVLWTTYVVVAGGDFMEFRFMVPILPLLMSVVAWSIGELVAAPPVRGLLAGILVLASLLHATRFSGKTDLESIERLARHVDDAGLRWRFIGKELGALFGRDSTVTIAVTAAGAIPYDSGLRTIDMLGVNDRWVARHGTLINERPGHKRLATYEYLISRGVNLVIGHPRISRRPLPDGSVVSLVALRGFADRMSDAHLLPRGATIVELPLGGGEWRLYALYLLGHPQIDEGLAERGWRRFAISEAGAGP
jgi:hypothetical protein